MTKSIYFKYNTFLKLTWTWLWLGLKKYVLHWERCNWSRVMGLLQQDRYPVESLSSNDIQLNVTNVIFTVCEFKVWRFLPKWWDNCTCFHLNLFWETLKMRQIPLLVYKKSVVIAVLTTKNDRQNDLVTFGWFGYNNSNNRNRKEELVRLFPSLTYSPSPPPFNSINLVHSVSFMLSTLLLPHTPPNFPLSFLHSFLRKPDTSDELRQRSLLLISGMGELLRAMLDFHLISPQPSSCGQACYSLSLYGTGDSLRAFAPKWLLFQECEMLRWVEKVFKMAPGAEWGRA